MIPAMAPACLKVSNIVLERIEPQPLHLRHEQALDLVTLHLLHG